MKTYKSLANAMLLASSIMLVLSLISAICGYSDKNVPWLTIQLCILITGMAIVEAIESNHTIINVDTATIVGNGMNVEEQKR